MSARLTFRYRCLVRSVLAFTLLAVPVARLVGQQRVPKEQEAASRIASLGGWCEVDGDGHIVEVNMAYQLTADGRRIENLLATDEALAVVRHFPELERLTLRGSQASDDSLRHLAGMKTLRELTLQDAQEVTDAGIRHLKDCTGLVSLQISRSQISDESLGIIGQLSAMRELALRDHAFTDEGLESLARLPRLEALHIGSKKSRITDRGMTSLVDLPLVELGLQNCAITDEGMAQISKIATLERLWLRGGEVTDSGLAYLVGLPLRNLGLTNTKITDAGAIHLARIDSLEKLWIGWTPLTDAALVDLERLQRLQFVVVPKQVSAVAINSFRNGRPDLLVQGEMWPQ